MVGASVIASVDSSVVVFVVVVGTVHTLHDFLQDRSMNPALVSQSPLVAQSLQYWFLSSHIEPVDQRSHQHQHDFLQWTFMNPVLRVHSPLLDQSSQYL